MRITVLEHDSAISQFANLAIDKNLVPIFGSGFTKGCNTFKGFVPDGRQTSKIMKELILKNSFLRTPGNSKITILMD